MSSFHKFKAVDFGICRVYIFHVSQISKNKYCQPSIQYNHANRLDNSISFPCNTKIDLETVLFEKENPGAFLMSNKAITVNNGMDNMLLYLKISRMFIF